jgi:hypothetical protein
MLAAKTPEFCPPWPTSGAGVQGSANRAASVLGPRKEPRTRPSTFPLSLALAPAHNGAVSDEKAQEAVSGGDPGPCSRCHQQARLPGQRWCRRCRTFAQRDRRARLRAKGHEQGPAEVPSSELLPSSGRLAVLGSASPVPAGGKAVARSEPAHALAADRSTPVLQDATAAALARLRDSENEYERARRRDWRRSAVAPAIFLQPLADAVLRARMECRRLGVSEDRLRLR